jgi:hypothetical protein
MSALTQKVERQLGSRKLHGTAAAAMYGWDCAALRREELGDDDLWSTAQEVEDGECPNWKDITDCSPIC